MLGQSGRRPQDLLGELLGRSDALLELDADDNLLAAGFAEAHHAAHEDRGMAEDRFFDQVRVHGAVLGGDPVPGPVGVVQEAVLVEESDVVGAEPVAGEERLSVPFWQRPVLTQRHRAADDDLADLPGS